MSSKELVAKARHKLYSLVFGKTHLAKSWSSCFPDSPRAGAPGRKELQLLGYTWDMLCPRARALASASRIIPLYTSFPFPSLLTTPVGIFLSDFCTEDASLGSISSGFLDPRYCGRFIPAISNTSCIGGTDR